MDSGSFGSESSATEWSLIFRQIDQGSIAHFRWSIVKDALHLLQRFVDGRLVGQQGVCDVEVALFFGANSRHSIQCALIASVIGKAGARFQARDISLDRRISVLPQGEDR